jgi:hypothetical protein
MNRQKDGRGGTVTTRLVVSADDASKKRPKKGTAIETWGFTADCPREAIQ